MGRIAVDEATGRQYSVVAYDDNTLTIARRDYTGSKWTISKGITITRQQGGAYAMVHSIVNGIASDNQYIHDMWIRLCDGYVDGKVTGKIKY